MRPVHIGAKYPSHSITDEQAYRDFMRDAFAADDEYDSIRHALRQAIAEDLTPRQLECVKMYYVDKMTQWQIAAQIGTCTSTVNRHLQAAKRNLKNAVKYSSKWLLKMQEND